MKLAGVILSLILLSASHTLACQNSSAADRVIYLGDSHTVGDFGKHLSENLSKIYGTENIKRYGVIGAAAQHWNKKENSSLRKLKIGYYCDGDGLVNSKAPAANFPTPSQLFQGSAPPMVVIALGTNDVHGGCLIKDKEEQMAAAKELLAQIRPNSKCVWVGPTEQPTTGPIGQRCGQAKIKAYIDNLRDTVGSRCTFVDSRKITYQGKSILPNRSDKLHYGGSLANHWADSVAEQIAGPQVKKSNSSLTKPTSYSN
ncbi:MAG: SGNH/GDSL hydrolase family protein [Pseudobdellovibrio sp.]|nr:SGNH/GDSL hydrolase family protein [Pseudobdellovibrio sp.]